MHTLTMRSSFASSLFLALYSGFAMAQSTPVKEPEPPVKPAAPAAAKPAPPAAAQGAAKSGAAPAAVSGQSADKAPAPTSEGPMQQVEVVAERPTNRIDRQVYDIKSDISTVNSSAADALNNVPSVQVDPDGKVTLRGNQNVTILLDGKPSAMLQGENRGAALNAMPADFIESIEVVNNPGAEFGNEGGGGPILNMISRRNRRPGGFGSVSANYGTQGRYNTGINGSYSAGYASVDSFLNYRHDGRGSSTETYRESIDPISKAVSPSRQESSRNGLNGNLNLNTSFRYNVGDADRMGGSVGYQRGGRDDNSLTHYRDYNAAGSLLGESWRTARSSGDSHNASGSLFYEHKFATDDAALKLDLRVSNSENPSTSHARRSYLAPARPDELSSQERFPDTHIADFTADYNGKFGPGTISSGMKLINTTQDFDTRYAASEPSTGIERPNPILSNAFSVDERLMALYGTYEMRLDEHWSWKSGARVERTEFDIHQLTSHIEAVNAYTNVMPSAYLQYKVDKDSTWRLAYSNRLHRPNASDLNPYVLYQSPTERSAGNPMLKPAHSDSFELSYDTNWAGVKTDLRLFMRKESDVITQRQILIKDETGQDVILTTRQNFGENSSEGLEFVFNGKPTPGLTLNFSGNFRHAKQTQFERVDLPDTLTSNGLSLRGRVNYQLTADDQVQLMLMRQGRQLWGEGYREANWTANMSWQHKITPQLTMTVNGTDVFSTNRNESHTLTDMLRQTSLTRFGGRIFYVGLRYQLGGVTGNERLQKLREGMQRPEGGGQRPDGARQNKDDGKN